MEQRKDRKNSHSPLYISAILWQMNRQILPRIKSILTVIMLIVLFNILNVSLKEMPKKTTTPPVLTNSREESLNAKNSTVPIPTRIRDIDITYYELVNDTRYHYEFRFAYDSNTTNNDTRLMILLNGSIRTCIDYWDFAVGRRILATLRSFHYSILVICSKKKTYDLDETVQKNADVKWIYASLQKWINDVYYKHFQHYPRLYIHGISRVLPIQQHIFTIYPGDQHGMLTRSQYPVDLQQRLQLDPVFANWFYFDFCYRPLLNNSISDLCPFQSDRYYYQPVPPTYFIHLQNDRLCQLSQYTSLITQIHQHAFVLGGNLLNNTEGVKLYVMAPANATPTYMQQTYDTWYSKPHASAIFYEHYVNRSFYNAINNTRQTCQCLPTDFRYYQLYPNITQTWSKQKQNEYEDYANDIERYVHFFCEDVCGDLHTDHAMSSRHLDKALEWVNRVDTLRHSLYIQDYLARPLRIWMYNKTSIITTNDTYFSSKVPDYVDIATKYRMYSPKYFLQDYFQQLKTSSTFSRHNLQWANNPLLAEYFIIPSDLTYYYFYPDVNIMTRKDFRILVTKLNSVYFETSLRNVRSIFLYWTMAKQADQMGSNHILTILAGRNMGIFYNDTQKLLKNVIQIVFTGVRQDMLPPNAPPATDLRGIPIIYRHGYDVVIPPFTRLIPSSSLSSDVSRVVKNKKHLLFFAGTLGNTITSTSARPLLSALAIDIEEKHKYNRTTKIEGEQYDTLIVIDGHQKPHEYIKSIQSSVFSLCPEGYFPWSPRFYDAIQLGAIPLILADNIVLPFERFIDWPSFSAKMNVSNIENMIDLVQRIDNLIQYTTRKLTNAQPYADAFRWPYSAVGENGHKKHVFLPNEDKNGSAKNAFHYISMELRCRRLEQLYGLTSDSFSQQSIDAQRQACTSHPSVCPCHNRKRSVALQQYL